MLKKIKELNHKRIALRREKFDLLFFDNTFSRDNLSLNYLVEWIPDNFEIEHYNTENHKLAVYSTFIGDGSNITFSLDNVTTEFNHFFISNNKNVLKLAKNYNWIPVFLPLPLTKNKIFSASCAKIAKALPHYFPFLNNYDYLLYVDDKIKFDISKTISLLSTNFSLMIREHPSINGCILNEMGEAMLQKRYFAQLQQISKFIASKVEEGFSLTPNNLFWTSAILRNLNSEVTNKINEEWYKDILSCGINCQISMDFLAQKYKEIIISNEFI